jgi:hypothetical protein
MTHPPYPDEIGARLDQLTRLLAEVGAVDKIKDPVAQTMAVLMDQMLTFAKRNREGPQPDEQAQRRWLDAASNEYHQLKVQLDVVPALEARKRKRADSAKGAKAGGKATAKKYARPALDDLIRACLARGDKPPVKAWVEEFGLSAAAIYKRIDKIKNPPA